MPRLSEPSNNCLNFGFFFSIVFIKLGNICDSTEAAEVALIENKSLFSSVLFVQCFPMACTLDAMGKQGDCRRHTVCLMFNYFWLRQLWPGLTEHRLWTSHLTTPSCFWPVVFLVLVNMKMEKKMKCVFILLLCCHVASSGKIIFQVFL